MTLVWVLLAVAVLLAAWRGPLWLRWWSIRRRLLVAARARGLEASWRRGWLHRKHGHWLYETRNLEVRTTIRDRAIKVWPASLGWRREDRSATWWWITIEPLAADAAVAARLPHLTAHVCRRDERELLYPRKRIHASGDAAFDAELHAYRYEGDDPEANRAEAAALDTILASVEVRDVLRGLLTHQTDSAVLRDDRILVSVHREGASVEDVQARFEQVARLADAVVAALEQTGIYR